MIDKNRIIIHRGKLTSKDFENTIPAFIKSIEKGYAIELDVRLLKDKTIVVFHDGTLKRMLGISRKIEDYNYEELKKIKINGKYIIPTLDLVLSLIKGRTPVVIDVKGNFKDYELEKQLLKILNNYEGIVYIQSFNVSSLNWMWKKNKRFFYGLIILNYLHLKLFSKYWIKFRCDFVSCQVHNLKNKKTQKLRKSKELFGWTIVKKEDVMEYKSYCDKLICENIE